MLLCARLLHDQNKSWATEEKHAKIHHHHRRHNLAQRNKIEVKHKQKQKHLKTRYRNK